MKRRVKSKPDYRALVKKFEDNRQQTTQRQFCLDAGITLATFQSWLYKLRHQVNKKPQGFSRLAIGKPDNTAISIGVIEIHFPDQTILKLPRETSVETIKQLLPQFQP